MGIGNRAAIARAGEWWEDAHYPSWGSETPGIRVVRLLAGGLITPHGDRKHAAAAGHGVTWFLSHYPSWGSETG